MSRTVPSFAEEGLKRFLHGMDRRLRDVERRGDWRFDSESQDETDVYENRSAHLLAMSATADSIASGGDYVTFGSIVAQHGFTTVAGAGQSWTHPVSGVYGLTYEHRWFTYTDGGTVALELDGTLIPEGTIMDGTDGQEGRGTIFYVAETGQVGKIKVTQSSGSDQTCDALVRVAITDPKTSNPTETLGGNAVEVTDPAWVGQPSGWVDTDAEWIWYETGARPAETRWFEATFDMVSGTAANVEVTADNMFSLWINGALITSGGDYTVRYTAAVTLQAGANLIQVEAANTTSPSNPAGLRLSIAHATTGDVLLHTSDNGQWYVYTTEPAGWP